MDWFELTGCGIFPSKGILQFPDEEELNSNQFDYPYSILFLTEINDEFEQQYSWDTSYDTIKPVIVLNQTEAKLFGKVKKEVLSVIANSIDELGECATYKHKIRLADINTPPIYSPTYRKSEAERQFLKEEIDKMLKAKLIRPSRSAWSSPVIVVAKKGNGKRICIDYRKLNAVTITEKWPIPNVLDILDRLAESIFFTSLDLKSGYWQLLIDEDSIELTAFTLPSPKRRRKSYTHAYGTHAGVILVEIDENGNEYMIGCASRQFTKAEQNYSTTEKECLAFIYGMKKFRNLLIGIHFEALVDHISLKWLNSLKDPTSRLARWAIFLQDYDFTVIYRKGSDHTNVDALSRIKLEIPSPEKRRDIIDIAHSFGHFQVDSTFNRLKDDYYSNTMLDDVRGFVHQCQICLRNGKAGFMYHPAQATTVSKIFKRFSIDLVFGLPVSKDGYIALCVIVEFLSKYPYAKAIKSKTAAEISLVLIEYISIFGPFEELLSDQGSEFCNNILENLKTSLRFCHIVRSAYNPRTNGISERFNQTLIEALRKHAEANTANCSEFLPFKSTNPDEIKDINKRALEIKKLFNETQNDVVDKIGKKQQHQKEIQNNIQNTVEEILPKGKTVFIKCEGILSKLEPRFKGPSTIIAHTKRGNYKVANALNEILPDSFPLHKIKIALDDNTLPKESAEVEKIIKHKMLDNKYIFLVKWKNFPVSQSSWVPEKNFKSMKLVNDYKKSITNQNLNERPKRQARSGKVNMISINMITSLFVIFVLLINLCSANGEKQNIVIEDNFKILKSKGIIKSYFEKFNLKYGAKTVLKKLFMFGKLKQQIFGNGYHCMMKKHVLKTSESFFGSKFESIRTENMELNREECLQMVNTRKCNHNVMDCDGEYCSYSSNPVAEYSWMEETNIISYFCSTSPKLITAQSLDEHLFNKNCKVSDKFCILHDSVIVWDNTIFHECPLYLIIEENFLITDSKDILLSNTSIGLQITGIQTMCKLDVLTTAEGIFVSMKIIVSQYIQLPTKEKTIIRTRNDIFVMIDRNLRFHLTNKIKENSISHNALLLNGIDLLSTFQVVISNEMSAGTWYRHVSDTVNIKSKIIETKSELENAMNVIVNKSQFFLIASGSTIENLTQDLMIYESAKTRTENVTLNPLMRDKTMNSINSFKKDDIARDFSKNSIKTKQESPSKIKRDQTMQSIQCKENNVQPVKIEYAIVLSKLSDKFRKSFRNSRKKSDSDERKRMKKESMRRTRSNEAYEKKELNYIREMQRTRLDERKRSQRQRDRVVRREAREDEDYR
ncbi:unnamed protein product [Brachionus calyciflorus]|uniref:Reverse transcriptase n=1 Tax=Brachionus calyciflorus TaxID=104777 RepID=A0A813WC54_9BILA|nr:unnamed protein product [Brachionus calyciflorus]